MSAASKTEIPTSFEDEKLAHALVTRGFVTREEWQQARAPEAVGNPSLILAKLVQLGFLTFSQAQRLTLDLPNITTQQIPGYQILEKLGEGATGTVFKARQVSMDRLVAIKRLHPKLAANKDFLERFQREAHLAAKFSSNNVIQAIDVGQAGNIHYFVMEYVEGVTIKDELAKGKIYEEKEAVDIVLQIAQALQHAHRRNLIHRDIKPANIVITREGVAKLADLGMARATGDQPAVKEEKGIAGTPYYMAPEQIRGRSDIDSRVDIYALGATLFHMVTGRPPFPYPTTKEVLRAHLEEELTPPDHLNTKLSSGLGEVVEYMMAKSRKKRYPSPAELISDLECLLHEEPPKFAREHMATVLGNLAKGKKEAEEEEEEDDQADDRPQMVPLTWALIMMGILALSCVGNLFLLLRGRGD